MDLKLTGHDMDLTDGELSFVTGGIAIGQDIKMALRTWLGETVYDETVGVPYLQVIFKGTNPNLNAVRFILSQIVARRPGVLGVQLTPVLDRPTRDMTVTGTADTIDGEIDFSELIERALNEGIDLVLLPDVAWYRERSSAERCYLFRRLLDCAGEFGGRVFGRARGADDVHTVVRERKRDVTPNAARGARDDCD